MLSSQFNSGYRHQLLKKPLNKGFFDIFVFHSYQNRTIFCFFVILINIFRHFLLTIRIEMAVSVHRLFHCMSKACGDVDRVKSLVNEIRGVTVSKVVNSDLFNSSHLNIFIFVIVQCLRW